MKHQNNLCSKCKIGYVIEKKNNSKIKHCLNCYAEFENKKENKMGDLFIDRKYSETSKAEFVQKGPNSYMIIITCLNSGRLVSKKYYNTCATGSRAFKLLFK